MARLSALLPAARAIAAFAALGREADRLRAEGDPRGRGQLMADLLVQRLTGQAATDGVPVEICLLMTDETLLAGGHEPAQLHGYGPIPAAVARHLALDASTATPVWLRRIFRHPESELQITTPAGHHYRSRAPDPPRVRRPEPDSPSPRSVSRSELALAGVAPI